MLPWPIPADTLSPRGGKDRLKPDIHARDGVNNQAVNEQMGWTYRTPGSTRDNAPLVPPIHNGTAVTATPSGPLTKRTTMIRENAEPSDVTADEQARPSPPKKRGKKAIKRSYTIKTELVKGRSPLGYGPKNAMNSTFPSRGASQDDGPSPVSSTYYQ